MWNFLKRWYCGVAKQHLPNRDVDVEICNAGPVKLLCIVAKCRKCGQIISESQMPMMQLGALAAAINPEGTPDANQTTH